MKPEGAANIGLPDVHDVMGPLVPVVDSACTPRSDPICGSTITNVPGLASAGAMVVVACSWLPCADNVSAMWVSGITTGVVAVPTAVAVKLPTYWSGV